LLRGRRSNYRALIIDISLRGRMDGWEVARQAREIDPEFAQNGRIVIVNLPVVGPIRGDDRGV